MKWPLGTPLSLAVAVSACGRIGFEGRGVDGGDGGPFGDGPFGDLGPFGNVRPITEVNSPDVDEDPSMTADLLELYFSSTRPGGAGADIWVARRSDPSLAWSEPDVEANLSSAALDSTPNVSPDGLAGQ